MSAAIVTTWKRDTRNTYASHLRRLAQIGGKAAWDDTQRVVEMALFQVLKMGYRKATLRGCVSAVKARVVIGWLPELQSAQLWRFSKAPMDPEAHRPHGGPDVLQIVAEACSSVSDLITLGVSSLSLHWPELGKSLRRAGTEWAIPTTLPGALNQGNAG